MTPTGQHPRTPRTREPTFQKPPLDRGRVTAYRDHDASARHRTALPWHPARDSGRAVAYQDVLTLPPETNKDNHPVVALKSSSPSTPPAYPRCSS
jgi:hypothetical protein